MDNCCDCRCRIIPHVHAVACAYPPHQEFFSGACQPYVWRQVGTSDHEAHPSGFEDGIEDCSFHIGQEQCYKAASGTSFKDVRLNDNPSRAVQIVWPDKFVCFPDQNPCDPEQLEGTGPQFVTGSILGLPDLTLFATELVCPELGIVGAVTTAIASTGRMVTDLECPRTNGIGLVHYHVTLKIIQGVALGPAPFWPRPVWRWCSADWSEVYPGYSLPPVTLKPMWQLNQNDLATYALCPPHEPVEC